MKLNDKQIDDLAKLFGGVALSSIIGIAVGLSGQSSNHLTPYNFFGLLVSFIFCTMAMLYIRKGL